MKRLEKRNKELLKEMKVKKKFELKMQTHLKSTVAQIAHYNIG